MYHEQMIWLGKSGDRKVGILPGMANRHGLIAGATGTGKTITLKVMAESFSDAGVPVFLADVKGDLAGMCNPGVDSEDMRGRIAKFGLDEAGFRYQAYPVCFWDLYGKDGLPLRTTITEMGPTLLARMLELNQVQTDILSIVFRIADEESLLLLDMKDLRSMLQYVSEHNKEFANEYGNISKQSVGAIVRALVALEGEGGDLFFGEPALDIRDWFQLDGGRGAINILHCAGLINHPRMYAMFMLWMMSELFETLPEAGDLEKPKMVFFFDEAHLLFDGAPKALLEKIEQVVKLIRSKGVGIYFITQAPDDIPDGVLAQLGNKVQHALRAYTPADQKKVRAAARSFRENPELDTEKVISEMKIGEALLSFLDGEGIPSVVERCSILPPQSQMGPIADEERRQKIAGSVLAVKYSEAVDRDSAYEFLQRRFKEDEEEENRQQQEKEEAQAEKEEAKRQREEERERREAEREEERERREAERQRKEAEREAEREKRERKKVFKPFGSAAKSAAGTIGREAGNELGKHLGGSFGKKVGGNVGAALCRGILDTLFGR